MRSRRGSIIVIISLLIGAVIVVAVLLYKFMLGNSNNIGSGLAPVTLTSTEDELTKTDEISDIEKDLNSTGIDNLDASVLGITSEVE